MLVHDLKHLKDDALADLISREYKPAFDELYSRYWEKLFLYLVRVIKDREEAEDILQEVFVSVWARRKQLLQIQSLDAYLFSAVRFQGLKYIRKETKKGLFVNSLISYFNEIDDSLSEQQNAKEVQLMLDKVIDELPGKMQQVFVLSRKEHLSHKEIAEVLNISDKTVKKQINNALKIFKFKLEKENISGIILIALSYFNK